MRKARVEESSKSLSTRGRSQSKNITQAATKGEIFDKKKRTIDPKETTSDGKLKTTVKSSSTLPKQTGNKESDRLSSLNGKSKSKVQGTVNVVATSTRGTLKTTSRTATKKPTDDSAKAKSEKKFVSEKRGISTIYMPNKTGSSKSLKSLGPSEVSKAQGANSTRSKETSRVKIPAEKIKDASTKSKNQYSTSKRLPSRERRRSRTLSPSEVKVLRSGPQYGASSSKNDFPPAIRTSSNKQPKKVENISVKDDTEEEFVYEDDFEDYESDFEECTDSEVSEVSEMTNKSDEITLPAPIELRTEKQKMTINSVEARKTDEDRMLDSGHYELEEARRRAARVETITMARNSKIPTTEIIVQTSISPYREERSSDNKSLPSSMDEGFEDSRSGDFAKSPPLSQIAFIDFRKNPKENPTLKSTVGKIISRGEKLLEMIKLDIVEWSILESKPVAYEEFIRTHGKLNTRQISIQTNEDNLDVEIQTDGIECVSKWTQFPAKCRNIINTDDDIKLFNMERLGVGNENLDLDAINEKSRPIYDVLQLNEFLSQAGKVMLSLLEERTSNNNSKIDKIHELPFSESIIKLSIDSVTFLTGRPVTIIHYSNISNRILMTIHAPVDEEIETSRDEDFVTDCSIGCIWNILQPSRPIKIFYSPSAITACCFHSASYNVVLAGLEDGSISLWDLAEDETCHRKIIDDNNRYEWIVRSPTFSSIGNFEANGHDSEIVALRVLSKIDGQYADTGRNKFMPIQISSLDANGKLIIWSVLRNMSRASVDDLGLSWWGDLRLVKSQEIFLFSIKTSERKNYLKGFSDMHVDRLDTNTLYIATNTTNILHATRIGKHPNPPAYKSNEIDWCGETKCIENCPFDQPFFLVGCGDGTVRLHSTTAEKPLLQLKHEDCNASVKALQWSRSKPLTIYVLDVDSKIHVWDLGNSDMFPIHSVSTKNWAHIDSIELSPCRTNHELTNQYMALASDNGCVEVHRLKNDFHYSHKDSIKREINTFLRYVEIL